MTIKSVLTVGFLSTMAAAAAASAANSLFTDAQSVGIIESTGSAGPVHSAISESKGADVTEIASQQRESQVGSVPAAGEEKVIRVDVIDSLPPGWQWDSMKAAGEKVGRVDVIDRVEWRGPVYAFTSGSMRVDVIDHIGS